MLPGYSIAHYRTIAKLGEGGMGEVWRAKDTKLNRDVAIKILPEAFAHDADRMARFQREAQVLASLNHPNIAAIYGVEECALVLELVEGPTLAERIAHGPIPPNEALPIARQIAEALEYAHEKGIIHRDLKPSNIKLTEDDKTKILDFGLAKALSNEPAAADPASSPTLTMRATMAGVILGTAAYMSPEQARGKPADKRADIWAFGVVLYEMLTGRRLFRGETLSDTLAEVLKTAPDWSVLPPETPDSIRRLLRRCLERDRKRRLPDIAVARLEIDDARAGSGDVAAPAAAAPARPAFRWWNAAVALLALAGLVVAVVHFRERPLQPVPVRFQIPAPESADFMDGIALSPDGRKLGFIARGGPAGHTMIWVRSLDSLGAQSVPGTDGARQSLFWSPDGRSIGFWAQDKLKRVEASGGSPRTLCEIPASSFAGASWSGEGIIAFGTASGGLFRVPQAGGMPTPLTTIDSSRGELGHRNPWFLNDGRHFLFITRSAKPADNGLYVATIDGSLRKRLMGSVQTIRYAPPTGASENGHLLFLRQGTLMAQALDPRRFELVGEPFPVAEQVGSRTGQGVYSVSESGVLAYRSSAPSPTQLTWFDRTGRPLESTATLAFFINNLALSPDGNRIAMEAMDGAGMRDIWILDLVRGVPTRFTFDPAQALRPIWSPDGRRLVFASGRGGNSLYDIYEKNSSGSANEQLLSKSGMPDDWSPDGRNIVYELRDAKTKADLWVLPVGETQAERKPKPYLQTASDERQGRFSPDGLWLAYISDESAAGQYQVYIQSFPAGAGKFQVSTGAGGVQPRWRRDGKELFYIAPDGQLMAVPVKTAPAFEAGVPQRLFDPRIIGGATPAYTRYAVTADGKRFLVNTRVDTRDVAVSEPITVVLNWQAANKR